MLIVGKELKLAGEVVWAGNADGTFVLGRLVCFRRKSLSFPFWRCQT